MEFLSTENVSEKNVNEQNHKLSPSHSVDDTINDNPEIDLLCENSPGVISSDSLTYNNRYGHDDHSSSDNGETMLQSDSTSKPPKLPTRSSNYRSRIRNLGGSGEAPKKTVQVQPLDGKKFKTSGRSGIKKEKLPDTTAEIARCRDEKSHYLDLSNMGMQSLPSGLFKDVGFIKNLFLYDNKLTCLSSGQMSSLTHLNHLMLQQNWLTCSGLPADLAKMTSLEVLDLRHNRLEGNLPPCIYALTNLEQLLLSYNKIGNLSDELKNLQRLTILILNRNSIRTSIPSTIGQLSRLTKLDLSYNHIQFLPSTLGQCTSLRDLYLQHNQLSELPDSIGNLVNLTRLALKYNKLEKIPDDLANCTRLDEFNVENNHLSTLPVNLLCNMKSVQNVTLSRNLFNVFPPGGPEQYSTALTLNMDHNKISEIPPNVLSLFNLCTKLNLRDNEISTLLPGDLRNWNKLVELDLGSNHLTSLPTEIEALSALEVFRMSYNQLKRLPHTIGNLNKLRLLDLESNQLDSLPSNIGQLTNLQDLNVSCNRLVTFPGSIGSLIELRAFKAGENDIRELPPEIGGMVGLHDLYLNDNRNLNNIPAELSLCPALTILSVDNCPLRDLPQPIVTGGSAMIIYFLQQVFQLRRQHTSL